MINGEESRGNNIAEVTSPDPFHPSRSKSGGGASTVSSPHYSSCGESELDRYCSANSALGTPSSVATFNDCFGESEYGSVRSNSGFGLGDDFENFSLEGNRRVPPNRRIEFRNNGTGEGRVLDIKSVEEGSFSCLDTELREEDANSSRFEHSEGEDSMYNYGTDDDECRNNSYYRKKDENENENKNVNDNPLRINSSVAFGSNDWDDFELEAGISDLASFMQDASLVREKVQVGNELQENVLPLFPVDLSSSAKPELTEAVKDIPVASYQEKVVDDLAEEAKNSLVNVVVSQRSHDAEKYVKEIHVTRNQLQDAADDMDYLETCSVTDVFTMEQDPPVEKAPLEKGLDVVCSDLVRRHHSSDPKQVIVLDDSKLPERQQIGNHKAEQDALADCAHPVYSPEKVNAEQFDNSKPDSVTSTYENTDGSSTFKNLPVPADVRKEPPAPVEMENLELNEFYDEVVHDMEEILLESVDSPGAMFTQGNRMLQPQSSLPLRDGGLTASTSGASEAYPRSTHVLRIDGVEVVGAKQKKGDVSLSERLVGVKEYTVYTIRVWCGNDQWEVERRYRDFCTLHRRLKSLFSDQGWSLPPPWSSVEKESRKIFGNASPDVVAERSVLIQECLHSIIHSRSFSSLPSALIWFLSPQDSFPSTPPSRTPLSQSTNVSRGAGTENISPLGKTIALIVEIRPPKSIKQMLEAQHYTCAGCHKHFDDGMTLMRDLVQSLGWGKPRLCEYTGQLFCSSCHTNDMAVLPARVLHHWDFTWYPVSQMAKSYLDSIHDQPMLCVSAVNPLLFSKVPALHHVTGTRKKIGNMLPYVRCPFRLSINKGLGSRRYLLESNDFFALRDLIDLSKGAFAALPVMVETVARKIQEHIAEHCLICCDVGTPCSARQSCNDPSSLIFPFQEGEGEIEKCTSCGSVFHKHCFKKLENCPCGAVLKPDEATRQSSSSLKRGASFRGSGALDLLGKRSDSGFLSGLFSRTKPEGVEHKDNQNTILMGSLPANYL